MYRDSGDMTASKLRTIRLERRHGGHFGFALRGGREHKLGFYVTQVLRGSESDLRGLVVGDQVIFIDGLPVEEALHREMRNFIRSKSRITLSVRSGGMTPFYECTNQLLSWQQTKRGHRVPPAEVSDVQHLARVTLISNGKGKFGCSVCEGPPHRKGVYVQFTEDGGVARNSGIKAGDRILRCNGRDISSMDFDQAIRLMKESVVLNLIISQGAGCDFISPGESSGYNSASSSVNGDHSPIQNGKKRLSVVREEMIDIVDERRGIVIGNVTMDYHKKSLDDPENDCYSHSSSFSETINKDVKSFNRTIYEEEKKLQEERWRIQVAQKKLLEETEKLALERKQLEETRKKLFGSGSSPLHVIQSSTSYTEEEALKPVESPPHHFQHEQLMQEFKKKMVSLKTNEGSAIRQIAADVNPKESVQCSQEGRVHVPLRSCVSAPPPTPPPLPRETNERRPKSLLPANYERSQLKGKPAEMEPSNGSQTRAQQKSESNQAVRVSIGTYPSQQQRPPPAKFDFLPARSSNSRNAGSGRDSNVKNLLHTELSQTLSRARLRQRIPDDSAASRAEPPIPEDFPPADGVPRETLFRPSAPPPVDKRDSIITELKSRHADNKTISVVTANASGSSSGVSSASPADASTNKETAAALPSSRATFGRKPSAQIQAKMASLAQAAAAHNGSPPGRDEAAHHPARETMICQSPDNKVTIKINPYVSDNSHPDVSET